MFSRPEIDLYAPTGNFERIILFETIGKNTSLNKVDFPLPETPVIQVKVPKGISTDTFFKLCSVTPSSTMEFPFPLRRFSGTSIFKVPARY